MACISFARRRPRARRRRAAARRQSRPPQPDALDRPPRAPPPSPCRTGSTPATTRSGASPPTGPLIRLMRDNASLTRPAYIEADLAQIFRTRTPPPSPPSGSDPRKPLRHRRRAATDCALERWREAGSREGEAARDRLRDGVEAALKSLGTGFLEPTPTSPPRLKSGAVDLPDCFNELLRLVYRLIFLIAAEDRNLLHPETPGRDARKLYAEGYSLAALARAVRRARLGPAPRPLGGPQDRLPRARPRGGARSACRPSAACSRRHAAASRNRPPANRAFMEAIYRLAWLSDKTGLVPVNWRDMETEELGSVYESLLELQPHLTDDGRRSPSPGGGRAEGQPAQDHRQLLHARQPRAGAARHRARPGARPARGRGRRSRRGAADAHRHRPRLRLRPFPARRRAPHRHPRSPAPAPAASPAPADYRHALRDVARPCIHGVDRNPMAVELTKVALWIETVEPGKPLGFLDANIRCGDRLLGVFDLQGAARGHPRRRLQAA